MDEKMKEKLIKLLALRYQAKSKLLGENVRELRAIKRELRKAI
jgi:ribosomal protein L29